MLYAFVLEQGMNAWVSKFGYTQIRRTGPHLEVALLAARLDVVKIRPKQSIPSTLH